MKDKIAYLFDPIDIDTLSVELMQDDPGLFAFQVILSGEPDLLWRLTFDLVWKESRYLGKLGATVQDDTIRFVCRQSQGIEDYLYFIECRIGETNRRMRRFWTARGVRVEGVSGRLGLPFPPSVSV